MTTGCSPEQVDSDPGSSRDHGRRSFWLHDRGSCEASVRLHRHRDFRRSSTQRTTTAI